MALLIFILVVLVVLCLALYACSLAPTQDGRVVRLLQLACILIAIVAIVQRAGLV